MRLEQSFEVPVPVSRAWGVLLDVEQIAPCMPGATLTGYDGTGFTGLVKVKLGPVVMSFKGSGRFVERDESARRVVIEASGQETKGAGAAQARVTAELQENQGGAATLVNVVADLEIAGRAAQFGRGMIADVNRRLVQQFADCLARTIAAEPAGTQPPAAPPADASAAAAVEAAPAEQAADAAQAAPSAEAPAPSGSESAESSGAEVPAGGAAALGAAPAAEVAPAAAEAAAPTAPTAPPADRPAESGAPPTQLARPIEGEPIDLLAVTGAKGMARRAGPIVAIILIIVVAVVVYLVLS